MSARMSGIIATAIIAFTGAGAAVALGAPGWVALIFAAWLYATFIDR